MPPWRTRRASVAGYCYPADPAALREAAARLGGDRAGLAPAGGVIAPHGSWQQSGRILGAAFAGIRVPRRCIIVGPSHAGVWAPSRIMTDGAYRTPLGDVPVETGAAEALRARCGFLQADERQAGEHAIEVVLPILQQLGPADLTVVPVITGTASWDECLLLGQALAQVIRQQEEAVLLVASADLTHYEPESVVRAQDAALLRAVGAVDASAFWRETEALGGVICGAAPVAAVLEAAGRLGAMRGTVAAYGTSAESGGDPQSAIGYAGVIIR